MVPRAQVDVIDIRDHPNSSSDGDADRPLPLSVIGENKTT